MTRTVIYSVIFLFTFSLLACNKADNSGTESTTLPSTDETPDEISSFDGSKIGAGKKTIRDRLVKKYKDLLVFHADDTMEVNKTYTATLALSRNLPLGPIKMRVLEESDATDDNVLIDSTIELGKRMKANLRDFGPRDSKSFIIEQIGTDEQNLTESKESIWQWNIEPLKAGTHKLKLSIQVILGDEGQMNLPTKEIPVTIFAQKVSVGSKIGAFLSNYWQWIITGILLPIFIAWLTTKLKHAAEARKN